MVAQGGLAPVGVVLAHRDAGNAVSHLILTSPPTWEDMMSSIPETELGRNYSFLRNPFWGSVAFSALESRRAVKLFSDLILFAGECDEEWLERTASQEATKVEARPPVMVFNAGMLRHRSYEEELRTLRQRALVLSGADDGKRKIGRERYSIEMINCVAETIEGKNVLPWESSQEVCVAISRFLKGEGLGTADEMF